MRQRTELSEMPPVFTVTAEREKAIIAFFTDVQQEQREEGSAYTATMWSTEVPNQSNLEERISADPGKWLDMIKELTESEEAEAAQAREKDEALGGIVDMNNALSIAFVTLAENGTIDEVTAGEHISVFEEWKPSIGYVIGNLRKYNGKLYKCVQAHTSQADWTPDVAVSLWSTASDPSVEFPDWSQPVGAHDAYMHGDKVAHADKHWISDVDNNVWEPGVYGWTETE